MILRSIALTNFKNIAAAQLEFSPKINCLLGDNGMGKSNLLDAIYYLSFTRSFNRVPDSMLIRTGEEFTILKGQYLLHDDQVEEITASLRRGARKSLRRGGKEYQRLSSHIGLLPAVMVAPADMSLITESGEERRRFADMIISQSDPAYLNALIRYNHMLEQRNRLLRDGTADRALFESIEMMMDASAEIIISARQRFVNTLDTIFAPFYTLIAGCSEVPGMEYHASTDGHPTLADALEHARTRDTLLRHTTIGPHRDDITFTLNGMPVKATASQGQIKTFTIALRLAQYEFLVKATGMKPLLLLDDIFDKLDANRVERIVSIVSTAGFGQIFITDTNRDHLDEIMARAHHSYRMWHVTDGQYTPLSSHEED